MFWGDNQINPAGSKPTYPVASTSKRYKSAIVALRAIAASNATCFTTLYGVKLVAEAS
jgi:hypothetical protein